MLGVKVIPSVKNYSWGSKGSDSLVAKLVDLHPDPNVPYAELWVGVHPAGVCKVQSEDEKILELPQILNQWSCSFDSNCEFPFLFKILSVNLPLSIQLHPDKAMAEKLHSTQCDVYRDPNHKPEMLLALSPFVLLYGFRGAGLVRELLLQDVFTPISELLRENGINIVQAELKDLLSQMLDISESDVESAVHKCLIVTDTICSKCKRRISHPESSGRTIAEKIRDYSDCVFCTAHVMFRYLAEKVRHSDCGILIGSLLMMTHHLNAGESIYVPPNQPHCYIQGHGAEIMANSDNVVRAGLTSKYMDKKLLTEIVDYSKPNMFHLVTPQLLNSGFSNCDVFYFTTPAEEFRIYDVKFTSKGQVMQFKHKFVVLLFVLQGTVLTELFTKEDCQQNEIHTGKALIIRPQVNVIVRTNEKNNVLIDSRLILATSNSNLSVCDLK